MDKKSLTSSSQYPKKFSVGLLVGFFSFTLGPSTLLANPNTTVAWSDSSVDEAPSPIKKNTQKNSYTESSSGSIQSSPFAPGSHNFSLDLGEVILLGNVADLFNDSLGVQIHYNYGVSDLFSFDSIVGFSEHTGGKLSIFSLLAGIRANLAWFDKVIPFATGGLGFYRFGQKSTAMNSQGSIVQLETPVSAFVFGIHAGAGVDLEINQNFFFGASFVSHFTFGSGQMTSSDQAITLGGAYLSFLGHVGVSF